MLRVLSVGRVHLRAAAWSACFLGLLAVTVMPTELAAQEQGPPADEQVLEAERLERERLEEEERVERERAEQARVETLAAALATSVEELSAAESGLLSALASANRANGDRVVAGLDLEDARDEEARSLRRIRRTEVRLRRSHSDLEAATEALAIEAAAAYRTASAADAPMAALHGLARSRDPEHFVEGLSYLRAMRPNRLAQRHEAEAEVERWASGLQAANEAYERAQAATREAEAAVPVAEAQAARAEQRLRGVLAAHARRAQTLVNFAAAERRAAEEADVPVLTAESVRLATEIEELAGESARLAVRVGTGSARIAAGKDGPPPWRDFLCPVDGPVRFTNDWGFPRSEGRSHEGTDVFAPGGTPVTAMADGVVEQLSRIDVGLGGKSVTYVVDGHRIYNAHLDTVADGLEPGAQIVAGEQIGTVGTTGNARGTPPHNHVGMYQPDGAPVNPYPILRRSCR